MTDTSLIAFQVSYIADKSPRQTVGPECLVYVLRGVDFTGKLKTGWAFVTKLPYHKNTVAYMGEDNKERIQRNAYKKKLSIDNYLNSSSGITGVRPLI